MTDFVEATEAGNWSELGWPNSTYVVSKIGLCALSRIQQREFNKDSRKVHILPFKMIFPIP
jgi:carbonyl reductase 1